MAKANQLKKSKLMNSNFDTLISTLTEIATSSEEIMPLLSESIKLSVKIAQTYKKAFNVGAKYVK